MQASEDGVHRPHVSGIHGRDHEGAFSIVLAGGYEDDMVRWVPGYTFLYFRQTNFSPCNFDKFSLANITVAWRKALPSHCFAQFVDLGINAKRQVGTHAVILHIVRKPNEMISWNKFY